MWIGLNEKVVVGAPRRSVDFYPLIRFAFSTSDGKRRETQLLRMIAGRPKQ